MTLLLEDKDVEQILTYDDAINSLENAYRQYGLGLAGGNDLICGSPVVPRCEMRVKGKNLPHLHPEVRSVSQSMAFLEETGMIVTRQSFNLGNRRSVVDYLIDANTGELLAQFKSYHAWWMRLGSEGAIGSKFLSRKDSEVIGMIGAGRAAKHLLPAIMKVRDIKKVFVYAGRKEDYKFAEQFANEMKKTLKIEIIPSNDPEIVVRNADILVTATRSQIPIVNSDWVENGLHINAIGADSPLKAELDAMTFKKADKLVIDYYLSLDTKELRVPIKKGILKIEDIYGNIGEVVAGIKEGRKKDSEITIFKDTGMTLPYVTLYDTIYKKAKEKNLGSKIEEKYMSHLYL